MRSHAVRLALLTGLLSTAAALAHGQVPGLELEGNDFFESFGSSVASGVDLDGDGIDDLVVGSRYYDLGLKAARGRVQVQSGRDGHVLTFQLGAESYDYFGWSVAAVPDLDGDGLGEYFVGAPGADNGNGLVAMYSGANSALLWSVKGSTGAQLGSSVALAGDVDRDRKVDVIAGAPGIDTAYVYGWNTGILHTLTGSSGTRFGESVAGGQDVDGDSVPDLAVGSPLFGTFVPVVPRRGRVEFFSGKFGSKLFDVRGDDSDDQLGWSTCLLGDVDGDGRSELVAGTPVDADQGTDSGLVRVYDSNGTIRYTLRGVAGDRFGTSLASLPDMSGDGLPDLAVGATGRTALRKGRADLFAGVDGTGLWTIAPPPSYQTDLDFGHALAAGDFNGDGVTDLAVTDPDADRIGQSQFLGLVTTTLLAPARWRNYGTGYPGTLGVPSLTASNDPGIGQSLTVKLGNSSGVTTRAFLTIGFSKLDLPTSAGGTLLVRPAYQIPLTLPAGGLSLTDTLPLDFSLLLVEMDLQHLVVDPGASHGLAFSAGLELILGIDYP